MSTDIEDQRATSVVIDRSREQVRSLDAGKAGGACSTVSEPSQRGVRSASDVGLVSGTPGRVATVAEAGKTSPVGDGLRERDPDLGMDAIARGTKPNGDSAAPESRMVTVSVGRSQAPAARQRTQRGGREPERPPGLIGESAMIRRVRALIDLYGREEVTMLILGESGTGKELVARAVARRNVQLAEPFVARNLAGATDALIDAEISGFERGSFTGAVEGRPGVFEVADGGTLFLDEAGDLSVSFSWK